MARDPHETLRSLRRMTVANGCTEGEADNAKRMAEGLCTKLGLPLDFGVVREVTVPKARNSSSFDDMVRRAAAKAREDLIKKMQEDLLKRQRAQTEAKRDPNRRTDFSSVRECAEFYMNRRWIDRKTQKPLSNAQVAALVREIMKSKTTAASVAWYRAQAKKGGL